MTKIKANLAEVLENPLARPIDKPQCDNGRIGEIIGKRKKRLGALGERLVVKHLKNKGFKHVISNYHHRLGEIDIVMETPTGRLHFIEVKTVSCGTMGLKRFHEELTRHKPEENVGRVKIRKIARMVSIYLSRNRFMSGEWQFDVAVVYVDQKRLKAHIKFIKDIPLSL